MTEGLAVAEVGLEEVAGLAVVEEVLGSTVWTQEEALPLICQR